MSFMIKYKENSFIISIVQSSEDEKYIVLATNFKQYYIEKDLTHEIIQERLNENSSVIFKIGKVINALLNTNPTCSSIEIKDSQLKIMLDLSIKVNEQKSEKLKLNFELTECTSIEEVSKYFIAGCVKQIMEQFAPVNKIILTNATFQLTNEVLKMHKDLSAMLDGRTEKDQAQETLQKKALEVKGRKKGVRTSNRVIFKPTQLHEEKKFEFEDTISQEIDINEDLTPQLPGPSTSSSLSAERQEEKPVKKKSKKYTVNF